MNELEQQQQQQRKKLTSSLYSNSLSILNVSLFDSDAAVTIADVLNDDDEIIMTRMINIMLSMLDILIDVK